MIPNLKSFPTETALKIRLKKKSFIVIWTKTICLAATRLKNVF